MACGRSRVKCSTERCRTVGVLVGGKRAGAQTQLATKIRDTRRHTHTDWLNRDPINSRGD